MKYFFLASLAFLCSCNYQIKKTPASLDSTASTISGEQTIGWALVQKQVLNNCIGCHSGLVQPTFISIGDVKLYLNSISIATQSESMPPSSSGYPKLTACQNSILKEWGKAGAPDQTGILVSSLAECKSAGAPPPTNPPITPPANPPVSPGAIVYLDWKLINTKVLVSCSACHGSTFNTYSTASARVQKIIQVVTANSMPPRNPLGVCQKTLLHQWGSAGAPQATRIQISDFPECANFL